MTLIKEKTDPLGRSKIMLVFGTRPEAIKMAPLFHALKSQHENFQIIVCVTAQHREMLDQVLGVFDITPDIDLNLMKPGQDLFDVTSDVLLAMRDVLRAHRPDTLLVHGDTTTSFASALAGFYSGIPVGHVEAGLRTFDVFSPFPEEFNRQVTTKLARWHFAPTVLSRQNLIREGVEESSIVVTGNTVIDAMLFILKRIDNDLALKNKLITLLNDTLSFNWRTEKFILITGHRRENFGSGFLEICEAVKELSIKHPKFHFIYPVHFNPNVQAPVNELLGSLDNVHLISPLNYEPFLYLLRECYLVLTDSGGIQEEAPTLGKPVLVMREVTERPEAVDAGTVRLVGANRESIVRNVTELLEDKASYAEMSSAHSPYGDGHACERIINVLRGT